MGQPFIVQVTPVTSGGGGLSANFPGATTPGNVIVIYAGSNNGTLYAPSFNDSASNAYTQAVLGVVPVGTSNGRAVAIGYTWNNTSSATSVTLISGAGTDWLYAEEWNGIRTASDPLLNSNSNDDATGSSTTPTVNVTTLSGNLVLGMGVSNSTSFSLGSGFTLGVNVNTGAFQGLAEHKIILAPGTLAVTGGTAVPDWVISGAVFATTFVPTSGPQPEPGGGGVTSFWGGMNSSSVLYQPTLTGVNPGDFIVVGMMSAGAPTSAFNSITDSNGDSYISGLPLFLAGGSGSIQGMCFIYGAQCPNGGSITISINLNTPDTGFSGVFFAAAFTMCGGFDRSGGAGGVGTVASSGNFNVLNANSTIFGAFEADGAGVDGNDHGLTEFITIGFSGTFSVKSGSAVGNPNNAQSTTTNTSGQAYVAMGVGLKPPFTSSLINYTDAIFFGIT